MALSRKFNLFLLHILERCIQLYRRFLSMFLGGKCRFYPSCSEYGLSLCRSNQSFIRVSLLIVWRILRCQPLNAGGYDPAPSFGDKIKE